MTVPVNDTAISGEPVGTGSSEDVYLAEVGTEKYMSLQDAIDNSTGDVTIKLLSDISYGTINPGSVLKTVATIPNGRTIVLDLNSYDISAQLQTDADTYGNAQVIRNEGVLKITDSSGSPGTISSSATYGCTSTVRNQGGSLTIENIIISSQGGNAIRNQNGDTTITSGTVFTTGEFKSFDNGTAAIHNRGILTISGGNFSTEYQAPVWYGSGSGPSTTMISGGTFKSTYSGVDVQGSGGTVTLTGGTYHVDPSDYVQYDCFTSKESTGFIVIGAKNEISVSNMDDLENALSSADYSGITIIEDLTIDKEITLPNNAFMEISPGITLTMGGGGVLNLNGYLLNKGLIDVSTIADGYINDMGHYVDLDGEIIGVPGLNDGAYHIKTATELQLMHFVMLDNCDDRGVFSNDIVLDNDIDLNGIKFLPLGYDGEVAFGGTLFGNNHTISNLKIDLASGSIGLFSVTEGASFQDLTIVGADLHTQSGVMGALVGELYGSSNFINIKIFGDYVNDASYYCGGWIGYLGYYSNTPTTQNFVNCTNEMNVTGCFNVGAFWGSSSTGSDPSDRSSYVTMINCSNTGNITATGGTIGIIGGYAYNDGILYNFKNTGTITKGDSVVSNPTSFSSGNLTNETVDVVAYVFDLETQKVVPYKTLNDAFNGVSDGETITLLSDVTTSDKIQISKGSMEIILDLGGYKINIEGSSDGIDERDFISISGGDTTLTIVNGSINDNRGNGKAVEFRTIHITGGVDLILEDVTISAYPRSDKSSPYYNYIIYMNPSGKNGDAAVGSVELRSGTELREFENTYDTYGVVGVAIIGAYDDGNAVPQDYIGMKLTVLDGTTIDVSGIAIAGNGSRHGTTIDIQGGTIKGALGVYHPQMGIMTVSGSGTTIEGVDSGIEIRAGYLTIDDGTISSTSSPTETRPDGSGTTTEGAGLAISQHTTKLNLSVTVNNGKLVGYSALYQSNPMNNDQASIDKVSISITDGLFKTDNGGTHPIYSENLSGFITGGMVSFFDSSRDSKYIATGYVAEESTFEGLTVWKVQKAMVFSDGVYYITIEDAIAAGISQMRLETDVMQNIVFPSGTVLIDLNTYSISGTVTNAGSLTFTGSGTVASVLLSATGATLSVNGPIVTSVSDNVSNYHIVTSTNGDVKTYSLARDSSGGGGTITPPIKPDEPKTDVEEHPDGSTTETTTETIKNPDGSKTESTTVVEKDPEGNVTGSIITETTTSEKTEGDVKETIVETTVIEKDSEGNRIGSTSSFTTTTISGTTTTVTEKEEVKDADDNVTFSTEKVTETTKIDGGFVMLETTEVMDSKGDVTSSTEVVKAESDDGSVRTEAMVDSESTKVNTTVSVSSGPVDDALIRQAVVLTEAVSEKVSAESSGKVIQIGTDSESTADITLSPGSMIAIMDIGAEFKVVCQTGSMHLDYDVIGTLTEPGKDVTVRMSESDDSDLTEAQQSSKGDSFGLILTATVGADKYHLLGGTVTVMIPYSDSMGADPKALGVFYIDGDGTRKFMESVFDEAMKSFVFQTDHFSLFVVDELPAPELTNDSNTMVYIGVAIVVIAIVFVAVVALHKRI
ncbi:hypothetical protein [Candidatus Methanoprimaticola sp. MG2]|uniref:hypothetical protein n=1 Tax=Candidatus Methanoprimaticola sp. MG2 TaxID=3228838 RepID=UPI0039C5EC59